ncbi:Golgi apyrase [Escovopsis weberi]|uniref:Golgi apyrase n=1 Tax=Escovopsis weberi TaxID=150374 RepID=A0A0M9VV82_ESCWE|nr:Golgi apyrase [Escovopsis weberi]
MGKHSQYGVILDAGSSGTRLYIYKWKDHHEASKHAASADAHILPVLKLHKSKKIHPGVSSFAQDAASVGRDHLQSLIDMAVDEIPSSKIPETPIYLMATAGMRFLPKHQQTALLDSICRYLQTNTLFSLPSCSSNIQVISGETEGLYGWIAANYLLGGFDHPDAHLHGEDHHTYGFLDMGGASAQIAFAPNATEAGRHADDLKLVRMRRLDGSPLEYKVFTSTWLGFGANKARQRYVEALKDQYSSAAGDIPDPCLPKNLRTTLDGQQLSSAAATSSAPEHKQVLVGTGMFDECLRKTFPLLGKDEPCENKPCLLNGQHAPAIDFNINHFVGVSEYWHTTHGVFGGDDKAYDLVSYQQNVKDFCGREWSVIEDGISPALKASKHGVENAREACFKASWLMNMLYDGIGIPQLTLEQAPKPASNASKEALELAKHRGFLDPFQPVDTIEGVELSWTLGKMVLYAAGQIPPKGASLPVGFGSNIESGTPHDFEFAGSTPLLRNSTVHEYEDDDDGGDLLSDSHESALGFILILCLLLFIAYLLRRPERRRRIMGAAGRYRRSGNIQRLSRGLFSGALFGRSHKMYDRLMEEGDAADLELGGVESDEHDSSDSAESSGSARRSRFSLPRVNGPVERFEEARPPSAAMDRRGLVLRTESCERLAPPSLQMLTAGRRSRAGSPTRLKSPLMSPMESLD